MFTRWANLINIKRRKKIQQRSRTEILRKSDVEGEDTDDVQARRKCPHFIPI
jgi:hypothetical protein